MKAIALVIIFSGLALAQANTACPPIQAEKGVVIDLSVDFGLATCEVSKIQYPAVAKAASVQGIVILRAYQMDDVFGGVDTQVESGPAMLRGSCEENVKNWGITAQKPLTVRCDYRLTGKTVKRGNRFTRLLMRAAFLPTTKKLPCGYGYGPTEAALRLAASGPVVEIKSVYMCTIID